MPLGAKRIAAVPKTRREAIMGRGLLLLMTLCLLSTGATGVEGSDGRADPDRPKPRARELGLEFGVLPTGCAFSIFVFTDFIGLFRPALFLHPRMIHPLDP